MDMRGRSRSITVPSLVMASVVSRLEGATVVLVVVLVGFEALTVFLEVTVA